MHPVRLCGARVSVEATFKSPTLSRQDALRTGLKRWLDMPCHTTQERDILLSKLP